MSDDCAIYGGTTGPRVGHYRPTGPIEGPGLLLDVQPAGWAISLGYGHRWGFVLGWLFRRPRRLPNRVWALPAAARHG